MSELLTGYRLSDFDDLEPQSLEASDDAWDEAWDKAAEFDSPPADDRTRQMSMLIDVDLTFLQAGAEPSSADMPGSRSAWSQPSSRSAHH